MTGDTIYHQICGIPMGSNFSNSLANLFLFTYEKKCKEDLNAYRFVDDILFLNLEATDKDIADIYPEELNLIPTTVNDQQTHFLDLDIKLSSEKMDICLFDKRRTFNFEILNLPKFNSCIHKKILINVIISQLFRFSNICNNSSNLCKEMDLFVNRLLNNDFPINFLVYISKRLNIS